jgi:hypothetical protein
VLFHLRASSTERQRDASVARARFGTAWVTLTLVLALHVLDEALTDFLSVYNPMVRQARAWLGWFPMPEFTFGVWLSGLCLLVAVLLMLSPSAFRARRAVRLASYPYALIMFLNGIAHLAGSVYLGRRAPGATTAPLLLVSSSWLWYSQQQLARREPESTMPAEGRGL